MTKNVCLRVLLLLVAGIFGVDNTASAQIWQGTPFDPGTWNPKHWVHTPKPPEQPEFDKVEFRNRTADTFWVCLGGSRDVQGWIKIEPGKVLVHNAPTGNDHMVKVLVIRNGEHLKAPNTEKVHAPFDPQHRFSLHYEGDQNWRVYRDQKEIGTFNHDGMVQLGLKWENFDRFRIDNHHLIIPFN